MIKEKLMYLRVSLALSRQEFSERLRIGEFKIKQWEYGTSEPDQKTLSQICKEFSLPYNYFDDTVYPNVKGKSYEDIYKFIIENSKSNKQISTSAVIIIGITFASVLLFLYIMFLINDEGYLRFVNIYDLLNYIGQFFLVSVLIILVCFSVTVFVLSKRPNEKEIHRERSKALKQFIEEDSKNRNHSNNDIIESTEVEV